MPPNPGTDQNSNIFSRSTRLSFASNKESVVSKPLWASDTADTVEKSEPLQEQRPLSSSKELSPGINDPPRPGSKSLSFSEKLERNKLRSRSQSAEAETPPPSTPSFSFSRSGAASFIKQEDKPLFGLDVDGMSRPASKGLSFSERLERNKLRSRSQSAEEDTPPPPVSASSPSFTFSGLSDVFLVKQEEDSLFNFGEPSPDINGSSQPASKGLGLSKKLEYDKQHSRSQSAEGDTPPPPVSAGSSFFNFTAPGGASLFKQETLSRQEPSAPRAPSEKSTLFGSGTAAASRPEDCSDKKPKISDLFDTTPESGITKDSSAPNHKSTPLLSVLNSEAGKASRSVLPSRSVPKGFLKPKNPSMRPSSSSNKDTQLTKNTLPQEPIDPLAPFNPKSSQWTAPVGLSQIQASSSSWTAMNTVSNPEGYVPGAPKNVTGTQSQSKGSSETGVPPVPKPVASTGAETIKELFDTLNQLDNDDDEDEEGNVVAKEKQAVVVKKGKGPETRTSAVRGLEVRLMPHQVDGLRFLWKRERESTRDKGGLLCDDMGLGKTIQTIALILTRPLDINKHAKLIAENKRQGSLPLIKTTLVVAPLALAQQWLGEIERKAPGLRALVHHGPKRERNAAKFARYDVVITTYQTVMSEFGTVGALFGAQFWRIVLDEAHTIKNRRAKTTTAAYNLESLRRWCLTGTPMQNGVDELQSLIAFCRIRPFDDILVWTQQIGKTVESGDVAALNKLRVALKPCMLRRKKENLESLKSKLTERRVHRLQMKLSPAERHIYQLMESRAVQLVENMAFKGGYASAMVMLLRLRQICDHVALATKALDRKLVAEMLEQQPGGSRVGSRGGADVGDEADEAELSIDLSNLDLNRNGQDVLTAPSTKMNVLLRILQHDPARKTIVFSQFTSFLDLIEPELRRLGVRYARYDGSMTPDAREGALAALRGEGSGSRESRGRSHGAEVEVLLCSLKAGAVGLNLDCASRVVLLDPWWNPMISEQAIDRVHRIGQTRDVDVYELAVRESVEDRILALQDKKRELARAVVEGGGTAAEGAALLSTRLTYQELLSLFQS